MKHATTYATYFTFVFGHISVKRDINQVKNVGLRFILSISI